MNFDLGDEQVMIRDSAAKAVREYCELGRRRERIARGEGFDREFWARYAELGWLHLSIPETEGGLGGSPIDVALLMLELGRGAASEPIISSILVSAGMLAASQWPDRSGWIEGTMAGASRLAFAAPPDSGAGSGLVLHGGDAGSLIVDGTCPMVFDGEGADGYLALAQDTAAGEPVLLLVPAQSDGLSVQGYRLHDGSRAADLRFARVRLDHGAVVARGGEATDLASDGLALGALACQAAAVGSMETCLELCRDYATTRVQFGQPIGKFQAIQHMLADMLVAAHNARSMLYFALSRFDAGRETRDAALAMSGRQIGAAGLSVARTGVQIHGGYGMTDEFAIGHHLRFQFVLEKRMGLLAPAMLKG